MEDEQVDKTERPAPKRKAPDIPIAVLRRDEKACLIQWIESGVEKRGTLPSEFADRVELPLETLKSSIPYGIPWRLILKPAVTVERLENELHGAGIWTFEDLQTRPNQALSALQAAYGIDLGQLLVAASEFIGQKEA